MKKHILLSLVLFTSIQLIIAQPKITVGTGYEPVDGRDNSYFVMGGEVLTTKVVDEGKQIVVQKINASTLKLKSTKVYQDLPKGSKVEHVGRVGKKFYVFYSSNEGKTELLYVREIDFEKGVFKGLGKKVLAEEKGIAKVHDPESMNRMKAADKYTFTYSRDSSLLAVHYPLKTEHLDYYKDPFAIGVTVFDTDLKTQWYKSVTLPFKHEEQSVEDFGLDDHGNFFLLTISTGELKDRKTSLFKIAPDGETKRVNIATGEKKIHYAAFASRSNGTLTCVGYYYINSSSLLEGLIVFDIPSDNNEPNYHFVEIPSAILELHKSAEKKAKNVSPEDRSFSFVTLLHVEPLDDGSLVVIGEQNYTEQIGNVSRTQSGRENHYNSYIRHSKDILIAKIDASNKLAWINRLPKRQESYTADFYGMGHEYIHENNAHYLYFLDNEKNVSLNVNSIPGRHINKLGGFLTAYVVDDTKGTPSRLQLFDTRNVTGGPLINFAPTRLLKTAPSTLVFESFQKKNGDVMSKIELSR